MRIILQRSATDEAAQHYGLAFTVINPYLDKKAASLVFVNINNFQLY